MADLFLCARSTTISTSLHLLLWHGCAESAKELGDVRRFLNRLLGLPVHRQNLLFNYFSAVMQAEIRAAKAEGRYSEGMSDLPASQISRELEPQVCAHIAQHYKLYDTLQATMSENARCLCVLADITLIVACSCIVYFPLTSCDLSMCFNLFPVAHCAFSNLVHADTLGRSTQRLENCAQQSPSRSRRLL